MKIAICDDEKIFRDEIITAVYDYFGKLDVECLGYEDGKELVDAYENGETFAAVFLDIEMEHMDGMTAAGVLRKAGLEAPIIFLTSHTEMAMDGYEVAAFRFLAKPIDASKMEKTLFDLKEAMWEKKRLLIRYDGEDVILLLNDIRYIEAMNNSVSIVLKDEEYTIRKKLSDLERELSDLTDDFARIHRGYIVNLEHVKKHRGNEVYLTGNVTLPLSRGYVATFKEKLYAYVRNSAK